MDESEFWDCVDKTAGPDGCWPVKDFVKRNYGGYGIVYIGPPVNRTIAASRAAYIFATGTVPQRPKNLVCHTCDNRLCCNPKHLYAGSHFDNARDMINRNRGRHSNMTSYREFTDEQIREIREFAAANPRYNRAALAIKFHAASWTIANILAGNIRREAGGPIRRTYGAIARGCTQ